MPKMSDGGSCGTSTLSKGTHSRVRPVTEWVAYRAHRYVNSVSNLIVKHRHGLVTDCRRLPIVPQSAP